MSDEDKIQVLIAEDQLVSRNLLCEYVRSIGNVTVAADGEEALQAFHLAHEEKNPFDLIFLDIMMPKLDGSSVLHEIRKAEAELGILLGDGVRVIMTTALDDSKTIMRSFNDQCEAYMIKPFAYKDVRKELDKLGIDLPESI